MGDSGGVYAKIPTTLGPVCLSLPTLTDSAAETVKMPKEILGKADKVIKPTWLSGLVGTFHISIYFLSQT